MSSCFPARIAFIWPNLIIICTLYRVIPNNTATSGTEYEGLLLGNPWFSGVKLIIACWSFVLRVKAWFPCFYVLKLHFTCWSVVFFVLRVFTCWSVVFHGFACWSVVLRVLRGFTCFYVLKLRFLGFTCFYVLIFSLKLIVKFSVVIACNYSFLLVLMAFLVNPWLFLVFVGLSLSRSGFF